MTHLSIQEASPFYQVTFSSQSIHELNKLDTLAQMQVVDKLANLSPDRLKAPTSELGIFNRNGKTLYRLRAGDYRIYFEALDTTLCSLYILPQHTWMDFVFRCKLPYKEEDMIEGDQSFWSYLENLKK